MLFLLRGAYLDLSAGVSVLWHNKIPFARKLLFAKDLYNARTDALIIITSAVCMETEVILSRENPSILTFGIAVDGHK